MNVETGTHANMTLIGDARRIWNRVTVILSLTAIILYLLLHFVFHRRGDISSVPLWIAIFVGGMPLLYDLTQQALRKDFGSDFLAGLSIVTAALMGELLVATIIILMLAGGQALEEFATRRASFVLNALAKRVPSIAHRVENGSTQDVPVEDIRIGDHLVVFPHEICPVDGTVMSGTGTMDESFLTGEPVRIQKISGSLVISGALNEDAALTIVADKLAVDSRFASIMRVMRAAEENPPKLRRLSDRLGAFYTPIAIAIAVAGWTLSGNPERFLAVIVIATPCPLLLAIPVAIIGAISLAAKRGVVIRKPVILEQVGSIRTMIFDKTGTLTHGEPIVTDILVFSGATAVEVLALAASLEQYSKHPLARAILQAAREEKVPLQNVENISEKPGAGLRGQIAGKEILITGRRSLTPEMAAMLPPMTSGMECIAVIDGRLSGLFQFHDRPRKEGEAFVRHLKPMHDVKELMILSGDRSSEVQRLAAIVGIKNAWGNQTPEEKLQIVRSETAKGPTLYLGDGINDAPAMLAATVGVAFGQNSDITAEAAGAVILEPTLAKVDELLHVGKRMRRIALQSAIGGMALSSIGMIAAALGFMPPLAGAIGQEIIDLLAVLNAVRASIPPKDLMDF